MSLRSLLWAGVLVLLVLGTWQFLRALAAARTERSAALPPRASAAVLRSAAAEDEDEVDEEDDGDEDFDYAPELRADLQPDLNSAPAPPAATGPRPEVFQLELENQRLRRELAALQAVIERQHDELRAVRAQLDAEARAQAPATSPEYSEALVLAEQGLDADAIAGRCGISLAEAELVLSLASGRGDGR